MLDSDVAEIYGVEKNASMKR
ncbi:MAG: hypothetical protein ABFD63_07015 [Smithella sp.]